MNLNHKVNKEVLYDNKVTIYDMVARRFKEIREEKLKNLENIRENATIWTNKLTRTRMHALDKLSSDIGTINSDVKVNVIVDIGTWPKTQSRRTEALKAFETFLNTTKNIERIAVIYKSGMALQEVAPIIYRQKGKFQLCHFMVCDNIYGKMQAVIYKGETNE